MIVENRIRQGARMLAERALTASGLPSLMRRYRREDLLILAYHNVVPDGESFVGDGSLHIGRQQFADHLEVLQETCTIVSLEEAPTGPRTRPRVAITFDDAYAGALKVGLAELQVRGIPATYFVTPKYLEAAFWWDEIADAALGAVTREVREFGLDTLAGKGDDILKWAEARGILRNSIPWYARGASEADLKLAASVPGITLASHTWSHPNLARLREKELQDELVRPLEWLRSRFAGVIPWLSYPYGQYSQQVEDAARSLGYRAALRVEGGWQSPSSSSFSRPRLNIGAGQSLRGFRLKVSGLQYGAS